MISLMLYVLQLNEASLYRKSPLSRWAHEAFIPYLSQISYAESIFKTLDRKLVRRFSWLLQDQCVCSYLNASSTLCKPAMLVLILSIEYLLIQTK